MSKISSDLKNSFEKFLQSFVDHRKEIPPVETHIRNTHLESLSFVFTAVSVFARQCGEHPDLESTLRRIYNHILSTQRSDRDLTRIIHKLEIHSAPILQQILLEKAEELIKKSDKPASVNALLQILSHGLNKPAQSRLMTLCMEQAEENLKYARTDYACNLAKIVVENDRFKNTARKQKALEIMVKSIEIAAITEETQDAIAVIPSAFDVLNLCEPVQNRNPVKTYDISAEKWYEYIDRFQACADLLVQKGKWEEANNIIDDMQIHLSDEDAHWIRATTARIEIVQKIFELETPELETAESALSTLIHIAVFISKTSSDIIPQQIYDQMPQALQKLSLHVVKLEPSKRNVVRSELQELGKNFNVPSILNQLAIDEQKAKEPKKTDVYQAFNQAYPAL